MYLKIAVNSSIARGNNTYSTRDCKIEKNVDFGSDKNCTIFLSSKSVVGMNRERTTGDCEMAAAFPQETETERAIPRGTLTGEEGGNNSSEEELEEINMCKELR